MSTESVFSRVTPKGPIKHPDQAAYWFTDYDRETQLPTSVTVFNLIEICICLRRRTHICLMQMHQPHHPMFIYLLIT